MNLHTLLRIMTVRWKLIAGLTAAAFSLALLIGLITPKYYIATTELIVDAKNQDPISGQFVPTRLTNNYIGTQIDIIQSRNVATKVIAQQQLTDNPQIIKILGTGEEKPSTQALLNFLASGLSVVPDRESTIISISFKSPDPTLSAVLANAFAQAFLQANLELRTEPAKQMNQWYAQQLEGLRKTLIEKQDALSAFQEAKGIYADANRVDLETTKLTELSSMLMAVKAERLNGQSRNNQFASTGVTTLPAQAADNPQLQKLYSDIAQAQAHLSELSHQVGENHPQYIQAQADVIALEQQLNQTLNLVSGNLRSSIALSQRREAQLQAELDLQKQKVNQLNRNRSQLTLFTQEVDIAQNAYNSALTRSSQTKLESLIAQTDVAVLNTAIAPTKSSGSRFLMQVLLASIVGCLLGSAIVLFLEWFDGRIRTIDDIEVGFGLPVLAFIPAQSVKMLKGMRS